MDMYHVEVPDHYFTIQKYSDAQGSWWRIYQSWASNFTLLDWLNPETLRPFSFQKAFEESGYAVAPRLIKLHQYYGQGKLLNSKNFMLFLLSQLDLCFNQELMPSVHSTFTITKFNVDMLGLSERLAGKIEMEERRVFVKVLDIGEKKSAHHNHPASLFYLPSKIALEEMKESEIHPASLRHCY